MNPKKIIFIGALVASLVVSGFLQRRLNRDRETMGITRTTVISNAPPVLAFTTVALGAFRGLIANALWIRTTELQEDGKYFEAVQLADHQTPAPFRCPMDLPGLEHGLQYFGQVSGPQ